MKRGQATPTLPQFTPCQTPPFPDVSSGEDTWMPGPWEEGEVCPDSPSWDVPCCLSAAEHQDAVLRADMPRAPCCPAGPPSSPRG